MKTEVLTSGYVSMDRIIKIDTPAKVGFTSIVTNRSNAEVFYGGCSVNIAYALCSLGVCAKPVLRVGGDYESNGFKKFLEKGGVPLDGITELPEEATSVCYLIQDNNNDHITIFYPGAMDGKYAQPLADELFEDVKLGVITVASRQDNEEFFAKCRKHKVPVVFGMKDDFDAFPEAFLRQLLQGSKIIFTNEVERKIIEKMFALKDITELFKIGEVEIIVNTLGKEGSICYIKEGEKVRKEKIGICKVEHVADATGSGDAYMAGFIYGYLHGYQPEECCKLGGTLSSFILQAEGCCTNVPTEEQLLEKVKVFD
ncbi:MAG: carbohydrate kinase family protein [Lachnospiraceae bacterium]|nr:carbohydrate kinase family protein [Lachnospiraceae bacterium]